MVELTSAELVYDSVNGRRQLGLGFAAKRLEVERGVAAAPAGAFVGWQSWWGAGRQKESATRGTHRRPGHGRAPRSGKKVEDDYSSRTWARWAALGCD